MAQDAARRALVLRRAWSLFWTPLAYLLLTLAMTWPLAARLAVSLNGLGDELQQTWILAWNAHALRTDPAMVWQAPIFYPYPDTLAYHDHHLILSLVAAPLIWTTGNPVLALNILVLLSFVLTGWAVYCLVLDLTGQRWPAFIAGAAFAFCAYRLNHLVHLNLLQTAWLPWAVLFLRRLLRPDVEGGGRWRDALLFGLCTWLQCANVLYYSFFAAAMLGGYALLWAAESGWRRARRARPLLWATAGKALVAAGLAALLTVPFLLPYIRLSQTLGIVRSVRELDNWSAPLGSYLAVQNNNLLHRTFGAPLAASGELVLFPGLLITMLGLAGLICWRGRERIFWGAVAGGAFVLSLGTGVRFERGGPALPIPLPYIQLYTHVPGFGSMRVPARWGMLVALALAVLAGLVLSRVLERLAKRWRALTGTAVLAVVLLEQAGMPVPTTDPALLQHIPPLYPWLGAPQQHDIGVVLELPVGRVPRGAELERITWRHFYSMYHWKKLPVAYGALIPFGTTDLMARMQRLPDEQTLRYLQILEIDTLVIHRDEYDAERLQKLLAAFNSSPRLRWRGQVGDTSIYTLLPDNNLAGAAPAASPASSIYISGDERMPGLLALALARRWQEQGFTLYGPGRTRYYAPLGAPRPGAVFTFGLLAADEDPAPYGFMPSNLVWQAEGLALYRGDPHLRANLDLARPVPGAFHPAFPAALDLRVQPDRISAGDAMATWDDPINRAFIEIDVASLTNQVMRIGTRSYPLPPGTTTITAAIELGQPTRIAGQPGVTALRRLRVHTAPPPAPNRSPALAIRATAAFSGPRLTIGAQVGGAGSLRLDVRGAAAYDDRPIHLLAGEQAVPSSGALSFEIDLLRPDASWVTHTEPPQDGRYIVYLTSADHPDTPGIPVAKFTIRAGALADQEAVPLPLTALR